MDGTYIAGQTIYDAYGQVIVRTKSMPALALSGASLAVPAYRPGLVATPVPLQSLTVGAESRGVRVVRRQHRTGWR